MKLVLLGGGGHASDVLGALEATGFSPIGFQDDGEPNPARLRGLPLLGKMGAEVGATHYIAAVGWPAARKSVVERAKGQPFSVIHPMASVPNTVQVGRGAVILACACVSPNAEIGDHAYVSHGALIGHDTKVGRFASVLPGASVSGDVVIGEGCTIGANATVIEGLRIGEWTIVGAGAVVTKDVPPHTTVIGNPARALERKAKAA